MMKLTTPATASAPYVADAPPVSTSTRSTMAAGIWLMSGLEALVMPPPGCMRRPLISTRVRNEPRPRKLTEAVPSALIDWPEPCSAITCGRLFNKSSVRTKPDFWMSSAVMEATGAIDTEFGDC